MIILEKHIVPENAEVQRLSDYAVGLFKAIPSRKGLKKAIKNGRVWVDGKEAGTGHWVQPGQTLTHVDLEDNPPKTYVLDLEVVFEDDYLAVINKPAGLVVSGNQFRTVYNTLGYNLEPSLRPDALKWPRPVHRLDQLTSGLLVIAKTAPALMHLGRQFEDRTIKKIYEAVVIGRVPEKERIDLPLDGQEAITTVFKKQEVRSLKNDWLTWVELHPKTGRTHQLRKHLAGRGTPILGDKLYGKPNLILKGKGLFLSAVGLRFEHPASGEVLSLTIETPQKFDSMMTREARRWAKYRSE